MMMAMVITRLVAILQKRRKKKVSCDLPQFYQHPLSKGNRPTGHAPQRLNAPIDITLALPQHALGMQNGLSLLMQIRQGRRADSLRLVSEGLRGLQALGRAIEALGAREELLALRELDVGVGGGGRVLGVVAVAGAEEGGAVGG